MGACQLQLDEQYETPLIASRNVFDFSYAVGKGGFGKVWKVQTKKGRKIYAMKVMEKARIITKKSVNSVMNERKLLSVLNHPFVVNMDFAFQDKENLYLIMDLMTGGDLRYHHSREKRFSEQATKFFVRCLVIALEYIHLNGIIHRDIKPENLVLDSYGYLRLTDFGVARIWRQDNAADTSGTPGYMAPEVMCRQNHKFTADYFALGVIVHEFMLGRRPYLGKTRRDIRDQILSKQVSISRRDVPYGWSMEAADFCNKLLQRKPRHRLGAEGIHELKQHPWLASTDWGALYRKEMQPVFRPMRDENFASKAVLNNDPWLAANAEQVNQNALLLRKESIQELFSGYNYDGCHAGDIESTMQFYETVCENN